MDEDDTVKEVLCFYTVISKNKYSSRCSSTMMPGSVLLSV
jgi:hypothetical protein